MANFCTYCGKALAEGEVCNCTQQASQNGGQPVQPQMTKEAEWVSQAGAKTKAGFNSILGIIPTIFKKPVTAAKVMAEQNSMMSPMLIMGVRAFLSFILIIITSAVVDEVAFSAIALSILLTIGIDCMEAALLKFITGAFNGITTMNAMFSSVSIRSFYSTIWFVIVSIFSMIFFPDYSLVDLGGVSFVVALYLFGKLILTAFQYATYREVVQLEEDKKVFAYVIVKAVSIAVFMTLAVLILDWGLVVSI